MGSGARPDIEGEHLDAAAAKGRHRQPCTLPPRFDGDVDGSGKIARQRLVLRTGGVLQHPRGVPERFRAVAEGRGRERVERRLQCARTRIVAVVGSVGGVERSGSGPQRLAQAGIGIRGRRRYARGADSQGTSDDAQEGRMRGQARLAAQGNGDGHRQRSRNEQEEQQDARRSHESAGGKRRTEEPEAVKPAKRRLRKERSAERREGRVDRYVREPQGPSRHATIFALPRYASAVLSSLVLAILVSAPGGPDAGVAPPARLPPSARALLPWRDAASPLPLFALDSPDLVAALGPLRVEVGAWAEYLLRSSGSTARMRFSLLPPKVEGDRHWLEVAAFGDVGLPFAVRVLLKSGPVVPTNVERAIVYVTGQAPLEIPLEDLQERLARDAPGSSGARTVRGAARTIATGAGRFKASEVRITAGGQTTRVWRSADVPLWGLVRAEGPRETIELVSFSHEGARSAIPEPGQGKGSESTNK
jgi:hypothetical protein